MIVTENPITAIVVLLAIGIVAYLGNRNSNQKTIEKTTQTIIDNNIVIRKVEKPRRTDFIEGPTPGSCGKVWGVDKPY
ncbi:Uncharacterised protein [Streptococcus pseudoporcinus]|uniref:Uncharacterized protein n=1 Tax=Streptococcus pseudoporcinus TaxID=361101 RepID=A0A4U9XQI1_9STRE|nr:hypothetical protein [Streptococcus pseudoporcinus]VTS14751.1 Uncharacterised protein [Streptococcus pseudoporcinus]